MPLGGAGVCFRRGDGLGEAAPDTELSGEASGSFDGELLLASLLRALRVSSRLARLPCFASSFGLRRGSGDYS